MDACRAGIILAMATSSFLARPAFADTALSEASATSARAGGVFVEIRTDNPRVRLDRLGWGGGTSPACAAPCRTTLERGALYLVQGDGIPPTSMFQLPRSPDQVTLDVDAGSYTRRYLGIGLMVGGGVATLLGFTRATLGGSLEGAQGQDARRTGTIMMGVGVPAAVIGFFVFRSGSTVVKGSNGDTLGENRSVRSPITHLALTPQGLVF